MVTTGVDKPLTYQPYLFMTTSYDIAKRFLNPIGKFAKINEEISRDFRESEEILLSPTKNNKYFQNFDYNIGYSNSDVFTINVTFIDDDYKFENYFVKFLFNEEKYRKAVEEIYLKKRNDELNSSALDSAVYVDQTKKRLTSKKADFFSRLQLFSENNSQFNIEQEVLGRIENTVYFVFGINDEINGPIAAQFRSAEVTQDSNGFKKIVLQFQNLGHPYLLSELTKVNINYQSLKRLNDENGYKQYIAFEYEEEVSLVKLIENNELDSFIKKVIKQLFQKITYGKEIIVLLPDFDQLYKKFITTNSLDPRFRVLGRPNTLYDAFTLQLYSATNKLKTWYSVASFLRFLGFTIESDVFDGIQKRLKQLPPEVIEALTAFNNQMDVLQAKFDKYNITQDDIDTILKEPRQGKPDVRSDAFKDVVKRNNLNSDEIFKLSKDADTLKQNYFDKLPSIIAEANIGITGIPAKDHLAYLLKEYSELIGIYPANGSNQLDWIDRENKITFDTTPIKFIIIEKQDGTAGPQVTPTNKNYINFHKFISDFSNNISKIHQTIPFRIGIFEENDLSRLKALNEFCRDYYNPPFGPLINDVSRPALVIGEDWLMRNFYTPIGDVKTNVGSYPLSIKDNQNFGVIGGNLTEYAEWVQANKRRNMGRLLQSSFGETPRSDLLNYIENNLSTSKNKLPYGVPVFICNDTRSNVLSYSLETDKLQHTSTYYQNVTYLKKAVNTEILTPLRISAYSEFLNYQSILDYVKDFASKQDPNLEKLFTEVITNLKNSNFLIKRRDSVGNVTTRESKIFLSNLYEESGFSTEDEFYETLANYILDDAIKTLPLPQSGPVRLVSASQIRHHPILLKQNNQKELYQKLFKVHLKTIPFFNINNIERLFSGAILIVKNLVNTNDYNNFNLQDEYNFLTGVYFIQSFRHVIGLTSSYSEFSLIKNPDIGGIA